MEVTFNKKAVSTQMTIKNPGDHKISLIKAAEPDNPPPYICNYICLYQRFKLWFSYLL